MFTLTGEFGAVVQITLVATAAIAFWAVLSIVGFPLSKRTDTSMHIEPVEQIVHKGDVFDVQVIVKSDVPVNVFSAEIEFSQNLLKIKSIDYNTSIANLWAKKPWYSNGSGTMNFAGGTTHHGGFLGEGTLITITFESLAAGEGVISVNNPRILLHDGFGTDAEVSVPIDAIFTIESGTNLIVSEPLETIFEITENPPSKDLNGDGEQTFADVSIFMLNLFSDDIRYDFNQDGEVGLKDLDLLLDAR